MKKLLFSGIVLIFLFTSCKKDNTIYQSYFWTSMDSSMVKMGIYIDGSYKGVIQYLPDSSGYSIDDSLLDDLTPVPLKIGEYSFQAKNQQGDIKFSATVTIKSGGSVMAIPISNCGTLDIYGDNNYLLFGISY